MRLQRRAAVVTGASGGLGREIALTLAREGADVVAHYHSSSGPAEAVVEEVRALGRRGAALQADISDAEAVERLVADALRELGRLDIWMNIAGADILTGRGARLTHLEKLERVTQVDLRGTVLCSWAVADIMMRQGSGVIVNVAWDYDPAGVGSHIAEAFAASKGGVEMFSKSLAFRVAPRGVRVNVIAPGWIETAYGETLDRERYDSVATGIPMKRWGRPGDIAGAALFLASDESAFVTGQTLRVNGGKVM